MAKTSLTPTEQLLVDGFIQTNSATVVGDDDFELVFRPVLRFRDALNDQPPAAINSKNTLKRLGKYLHLMGDYITAKSDAIVPALLLALSFVMLGACADAHGAQPDVSFHLGAAGSYNVAPGSPAYWDSTYPIEAERPTAHARVEVASAPHAEALQLWNTWTTVNYGPASDEFNIACRLIRRYVMQHSGSQWNCPCTNEFSWIQSCQNATAWIGITSATCTGTNCAQIVGYIKQGSPSGLQYRNSFTILNNPRQEPFATMWELKPERTPSQELTGEIFRPYTSAPKLERWVP